MKVEGYFMTLERANQTLSKLIEAGFTNSHIEIDDNNRNIKRNLANTNSSYSLSNLVIDPSDMKRYPLTSISPIVNVTAGFSEFNDNNYKIVTEAELGLQEKVESIMRNMGARFENDALSIGRVKEDVGELNQKFKDNDI
ncbi:hypothetical protein JK636_13145 [Clostridium sp. YIM B02515]|uniref:Uncharacterized protein n=1 Tax=Clostridium rhizosphaerae TaxID=2803861 RepID=A0ABS1TBH2_9CLOT|nr:hypothetical protein [Clostridium rhizosphaerae]MBL4936703.1 hypothetical protein [Clostridium rhizosphaerae]